jgi:hypothetical protein
MPRQFRNNSDLFIIGVARKPREVTVLGFEIWKNGEKLATAGLAQSGVVSFMLTWVGRGAGASSRIAEGVEIDGLDLRVGGIDSSDPDGEQSVEWIEDMGFRTGDEIRIKVVSAETVDAPARREPARALPQGELRFFTCANCGAPRIESISPGA